MVMMQMVTNVFSEHMVHFAEGMEHLALKVLQLNWTTEMRWKGGSQIVTRDGPNKQTEISVLKIWTPLIWILLIYHLVIFHTPSKISSVPYILQKDCPPRRNKFLYSKKGAHSVIFICMHTHVIQNSKFPLILLIGNYKCQVMGNHKIHICLYRLGLMKWLRDSGGGENWLGKL